MNAQFLTTQLRVRLSLISSLLILLYSGFYSPMPFKQPSNQLDPGKYIIQNGPGDDEDAIDYLGRSAKNYEKASGSAKQGTVFAAVSSAKELRIIDGIKAMNIKARKFDGQDFRLSRHIAKEANGSVKLSFLTFGIGIDASQIKDIIFSVKNISEFVSLKGDLDINKTNVCAQTANRYNGEYAISPEEGLNYVQKIYKGDVTLKIVMNKSIADTAGFRKSILQKTQLKINQQLKISSKDTVNFILNKSWAIAEIANLPKNYCKQFENTPVK